MFWLHFPILFPGIILFAFAIPFFISSFGAVIWYGSFDKADHCLDDWMPPLMRVGAAVDVVVFLLSWFIF